MIDTSNDPRFRNTFKAQHEPPNKECPMATKFLCGMDPAFKADRSALYSGERKCDRCSHPIGSSASYRVSLPEDDGRIREFCSVSCLRGRVARVYSQPLGRLAFLAGGIRRYPVN